MNKEKKNGKITFVIVLMVLALAALCVSLVYDSIKNYTNEALSDSEPEQTELELTYAYQNPQWNSAIENLVRNFEKAYPDIKVSYKVNYENKVYEDILSKKIARNELGDIVQLKTPDSYAKSDTLGQLPEDVAGLVTSSYTYNGKCYGVGAVEATTGIVYNKDIFKKYHLQEPKTYREFLDICRTLRENGVTPIGVGGSDLWHMEYWVNHFFRTDVLAQNENWLRDCMDKKVSWTDKEPKQMMRHLEELFSDGNVNENWLMTPDGSLPYKMSEGEIAMVYTGPWTAQTIQSLNAEMELGWFYVPDAKGRVFAGDNLDTYWSITKSCAEDKNKYEAAVTFLKYFYAKENYEVLCDSTSTFSLTREKIAAGENEIQADIQVSFERADRRISVYIGNEDTPEEFEKNMLSLVQDALSGKCSSLQALKNMQKAWKQYQ